MYGRPVDREERALMEGLRREGLPLRAIAQATGRRLALVHAKVRHIGQLAESYWTADEIATLQALYPTRMPIDEIAARLPKRTIAKIYRQARDLGLSRPAGGVPRPRKQKAEGRCRKEG